MDVLLLRKRRWKRAFLLLLGLALAGLLLLGILNLAILQGTAKRTLSPDACATLEDVDCILVLGCSVRGDIPSRMLRDRLEGSLELYQLGVAPKLLMSGDHGQVDYDEVNVMKRYAIEHGVPSEDVFMDHAGFSTYESMLRAKEIFSAKRIVVVTQEYHLPRALYIANALGLDAYGYAIPSPQDAMQVQRVSREFLARGKDVFYTLLLHPTPTYLGESIPVNGDGNRTND